MKINHEMVKQIPRALLEKTYSHHKKMGSTPPDVLVSNPNKTFAETMSDEELRLYILGDINIVREQYNLALRGDSMGKRLLKMTLDTLIPNIKYLKRVGRIPKELEDFDPKKEFLLK